MYLQGTEAPSHQEERRFDPITSKEWKKRTCSSSPPSCFPPLCGQGHVPARGELAGCISPPWLRCKEARDQPGSPGNGLSLLLCWAGGWIYSQPRDALSRSKPHLFRENVGGNSSLGNFLPLLTTENGEREGLCTGEQLYSPHKVLINNLSSCTSLINFSLLLPKAPEVARGTWAHCNDK